MSAGTGRGDRRRRVFSEGRLASAEDEASTPEENERPTGGAPRYVNDPTSVSLGIAHKLLPTGAWQLAGVSTLGLGIAALLVTGHIYRESIARVAGAGVMPLLDVTSPTALATAFLSASAALIAVLCLEVYGLRRQRSDDVRGVYRWWLTAALCAAAVSLCIATDLHRVLARIAAEQSGWTALPGNAIWWVVPAFLGLGAVSIRVFLDLKECRASAVAVCLAATSAVVALAATLRWTPAIVEPHVDAVQCGATTFGLVATIFALLAYTRRITREAAGLVTAAVKSKTTPSESSQNVEQTKPDKQAKKPRIAASTQAETKPEVPKPARSSRQTKPAAETQWVDGSQGDYGDSYDDGEGPTRRRLSKAERKRIRKQKERQNRAA